MTDPIYSQRFARAASRESISELAKRASNDVRNLITSQVAVYKLEAARRGKSGGIAIAMFLIALSLLQAALVATLVTLTLWAAISLGTGWAILLVVGSTVLLASVLAWLGLRQMQMAINPDKT